MANVILKNAQGQDVTYNGVTNLLLRDTAGGKTPFYENPVYTVSTPVEFTLTADSWNGTTYTLTTTGYTVSTHPQIGLPETSDAFNTRAVVEAALTVPQASGSSVTISAISRPTVDLKIVLFGLTEAATTSEEETT